MDTNFIRPKFIFILIYFLFFNKASSSQKFVTLSETPTEVDTALTEYQNDENFAFNPTPLVVCEGKTANLSCPPGRYIVIQLANFGRFSLQPCNENNNLEINTQCQNEKTIPILKQRCENQRNCHFNIEVDFFGSDPCFGTPKYLEVSYDCIKNDDKITTTPIPTTTQAPTTVFKDFDVTAPEISASNIRATSLSFCASKFLRFIQWPLTRRGHLVRLDCPSGNREYAEWMCSLSGEWLPASGPDLSRCYSNWSRQLCIEVDELDVEDKKKAKTNFSELMLEHLDILKRLHSMVRRESLFGGDLTNSIWIVSKFAKNLELFNSVEIYNITKHFKNNKRNFVKFIVDIVGFLLDESNQGSWLDLTATERRRHADNLLSNVERTLRQLLPLNSTIDLSHNVLSVSGGSEILISEASTLTIEVASVTLFDYISFPSISLYRNNLDTITVPKQFFLNSTNSDGFASIIYTSYSKVLGDYLSAKSSDSYNAKQFTTFSNAKDIEFLDESNQKIISRILSLSLANYFFKNNSTNSTSESKILLAFYLTPLDEEIKNSLENAECVRWSSSSLKWLSDGCALVLLNQTHAICECNDKIKKTLHFAVAVNDQFNRENWIKINGPAFKNQILQFLAKTVFNYGLLMSCIVTIFFTILALICLLAFGDLKNEKIFIHKNLCAVIVISECLLILGLISPYNPILYNVCEWNVVLFKYFAISVFAWTLLEAYHLYTSFAQFIEAEKVNSIKFTLFAYGVPIIFTLLSFVFKQSVLFESRYANQSTQCWILAFQNQVESVLVTSFLIPSSLFLSTAVFILVFFLFSICFQKHLPEKSGYQPCKQHTQQINGSENYYLDLKTTANSSASNFSILMLASSRLALKCISALVLLLALCFTATVIWLIESKQSVKIRGFNNAKELWAIVFGVANSLIGIVIITGFVIFDYQVRARYKKWLVLQSCMPSFLFLQIYRRFSFSSTTPHTAVATKKSKLFTKIGNNKRRISTNISPQSSHFDCPNSSSITSTANSAIGCESTDISECLIFSEKSESSDTPFFCPKTIKNLSKCEHNMSECCASAKHAHARSINCCHHVTSDTPDYHDNNGMYDYATIPYGDFTPHMQHLQIRPTTSLKRSSATISSNASTIPAFGLSIKKETPRVPTTCSFLADGSVSCCADVNHLELGNTNCWRCNANSNNYLYRCNLPLPNFPPPQPPTLSTHEFNAFCENQANSTSQHSYCDQSFSAYSQYYSYCCHNCGKSHKTAPQMQAQQQIKRIIENIAPPSPSPSSVQGRAATLLLRMDLSRNEPLYTEQIQENL